MAFLVHRQPFLLSVHGGVELSGHGEGTCWASVDTAKPFPKVLGPVCTPPSGTRDLPPKGLRQLLRACVQRAGAGQAALTGVLSPQGKATVFP